MSVTMREALMVEGMNQCRVLAGHEGLDRALEVVTVMEVPDVVRWLTGNELLLTSLYAIQGNEEAQRDLIRDLSETGTAALAIKPHRFIGEIPKRLLDEAERCQLPVIEIPEEISYIDILMPVTNFIYEGRNLVQQEDLDQAYHLLHEITRNKRGTEHFDAALQQLLKKEVTIDRFLFFTQINKREKRSPLAELNEKQKIHLEMIQRPIIMDREDVRTSQDVQCVVAPILVDGELLGAVTGIGVDNERLKVDLAILERASSLLSLELMRQKVTYELEVQYKSNFFRNVLLDRDQSEEMLHEKGKLYNFYLAHQYLVFDIHLQLEQSDMKPIAQQLNSLELICRQMDQNAIVGVLDNVICLLYPTVNKTEKRMNQEMKLLRQQIPKKLSSSARIGVGRYQPGVQGLRKSYQQAKLAARLGYGLFADKTYVFYEDLGVYRLLAEVHNLEELEAFHKETIGSLRAYDEQHDLDLMRSLRTYFNNNESLTDAARELYVHVNTMKYRLQKIKTLTNLNIQDSEQKLMLAMGLKIDDFIYQYR